jgi:hypothetical protein
MVSSALILFLEKKEKQFLTTVHKKPEPEPSEALLNGGFSLICMGSAWANFWATGLWR